MRCEGVHGRDRPEHICWQPFAEQPDSSKQKLAPNNNGVASRKASSRLILVSCVVLQTFKGE